jgi:hypothetical protein
MLTGFVSLRPAYGRDYKSAAGARLDFLEGKDFILNSTDQYCSIRDFATGATANIRYNKLTKVSVVRINRGSEPVSKEINKNG